VVAGWPNFEVSPSLVQKRKPLLGHVPVRYKKTGSTVQGLSIPINSFVLRKLLHFHSPHSQSLPPFTLRHGCTGQYLTAAQGTCDFPLPYRTAWYSTVPLLPSTETCTLQHRECHTPMYEHSTVVTVLPQELTTVAVEPIGQGQ